MVGIGSKSALVPDLGVVITAELAAGIAEERRHVRVVVIAERMQRGDAAFVIALVVDQLIGGVIAVQKILRRAPLVVLFFGLRILVRLALAGGRGRICFAGCGRDLWRNQNSGQEHGGGQP